MNVRTTPPKLPTRNSCHDCFSESNLGICKPCKETCHKGHRVTYKGFMHCFCDCGLQKCSIHCRLGSKCNFDVYGATTHNGWYECHTCWGGDSSYGCCKFCAEECHSGHDLIYQANGNNCDCGKYKHRPNVCTYISTEKQFVKQPFYSCYTCFPQPSNYYQYGCCYQCMKNCHRGHSVKFAGIVKAFCDCGLSCCIIKCKIASVEHSYMD